MAQPGPWVERMLRVVDHIQANLEDDIDPEELARIASFSLHHFHRVFRGMTGESVMGFVRRLRLERGAQRLKFSDESVLQVALKSGYTSHEAFTRAFKSRFGTSPSEYRDRERLEASDLPIALRDEPERTCVAVRYVGAYETCGAAWADLEATIMKLGFRGQCTQSIGLVYDDPDITPNEKLRYDACLVAPTEAIPESLPESYVTRRVPAGRYAVAPYRGPYEDIFETYVTLLGGWLPHRNVELADDPVVEVYLNNPNTTAPADLLTEVCVRIA